jgi:hypothetical protein
MDAMPTLLDAARMNYCAYSRPNSPAPAHGWVRVERNADLGIDRWENDQGQTYLAIAGTRRGQRRDAIDSLNIFFGKIPQAR